jgi:hypothetical protein
MTKRTRTVEIEMSKGYSGKIANFAKGWIAKITGTDEQYGLKRDFLKGTPTTDAPFRKSKCQWIDAYELVEGLYERLEGGERSFVTVFERADGTMACVRCDADRAMQIAEMMEDGVEFEYARVATTELA